MKNLFIGLCLFIAFASNAQNQKSLLWEVSGNGLEKPSYVFGTIHMIPKSDFFFTDVMQTALTNCETLVIEADMFSLSLKEQINLASKAVLPEGKTLQNYMDSADYVALRQFLADSLGIKEKTFDKKYSRFKPIFLAGILLPAYVGKIKTYEKELYKMSKKQKMELKALETVAFQMSLTENISIEEQLDGIDDMEQYRIFDQLVVAYKKQDLDALYEMSMTEYQTESELEFMDILVNQRNADWIPKIEAFAKEKPTFIAVGALHLPGEKGVLNLLEEAGYTVMVIR